MITTPGIYEIPIADYHGNEICDTPSISSSGLKRILKCPLKYWHESPLNPDRVYIYKREFEFGKAAHDLILDGAGWPDRYHILPEGFTRAATKKMAREIAEAEEAEAAGKVILSHKDGAAVVAMAETIRKHPIYAALAHGKPEQTLLWKDAETGVWLRCRPDFLPTTMHDIPDYKTCRSAHPDDFARDIDAYGYHQQAALYLDGIEAITGTKPRSFYFIAQEKDPPYIVQPIGLDEESIDWGRRLNRRAIRIFAECLSKNRWPAYSDDVVTVSLSEWRKRKLSDLVITGEL
jgi:hypothetical protein